MAEAQFFEGPKSMIAANDAGGVLGKKLEVVVEDNQLKPEIAVRKLRKLILGNLDSRIWRFRLCLFR